jgi:hypothetical protein
VPAVGVVSECVHDVPLGIQAGGVADRCSIAESTTDVKRFLPGPGGKGIRTLNTSMDTHTHPGRNERAIDPDNTVGVEVRGSTYPHL